MVRLRFDYRGTSAWDFSALASAHKPLLVVCAHHDDLCDRSRLKLPPGGEAAVIAHADHSFRRGLQELGKTVAAWVGSGTTAPDLPLRGSAGDAGETEGFREVELSESEGPALELDEG